MCTSTTKAARQENQLLYHEFNLHETTSARPFAHRLVDRDNIYSVADFGGHVLYVHVVGAYPMEARVSLEARSRSPEVACLASSACVAKRPSMRVCCTFYFVV